MRKLIYYLNMSLDGYISGPGNDLEVFAPPSEAEHQFANDFLEGADAMIMGRGMYEIMSYWDGVDPQDQSQSRVEREFAAIYQANPRYVLSRTLESVDAKATLIREDVAGEIRRLKAGDGSYLALDCGPELLAECLREGLVDELRILVKPFVLGAGKRLFGSIEAPLNLRLTSTQVFEAGSVVLTYAVD
jgi:dihydrofolate reductase